MSKMFQAICKMSQKDLKKYLITKLHESYDEVLEHDGFVYAQGKFPVLLVAHLDTVHKYLPTVIHYDANDGTYSSPQGIGGDDRCGVYMILEIIKRHHCSVLFCEDEEIGGIGARKFAASKLAETLDFNYIIEFDRKGGNDAVFYDCENPEFEEFITKDFYKTAYGTFSDISVIAPSLGCAAVNLSCGYYKAHTTDEYVVVRQMNNSINAACQILEKTTEEDKFEYIEATHYYGPNYGWHDYWDAYDTETDYYGMNCVYLIEYLNKKGKSQWEEVMARSRAEAVGQFLIDNPRLTYNDIIDIDCEEAYY